jgi:hypothetical protein
MQSQNQLFDGPPSPAATAYRSSLVKANVAELADWLAAGGPSLNPWMQTQRPADRGENTHETIRRAMSSEPDAWWQSVPAAIAWMMNVVTEGFTACGEAMQPRLFGHFRNNVVDRDDLDEAPRWNARHDRS